MRIIIRASLLFLLGFGMVAHASFDRAMQIYAEKRFEEAMEAFEALAAVGDRSALFNLGVMYYRGESVPRDPLRGYALMSLANDGIDHENFAAITAKIGSGFSEEQMSEAQQLLVELEPVYGIASIEARIYPRALDDEDCPPELEPIKRARATYPQSERRRGNAGMALMQFTISPEGYARDLYVERATSDAFALESARAMRKFRFLQPPDGQPVYGKPYRMVFHILNQEGERSDNSQALEQQLNELQSQAQSGDPVSEFAYGQTLSDFRSFKAYLQKIDLQYRSANEWFEKSASQGMPHAQYQLGRNMMDGRGCEVDRENGLKWISAAAAAGYSPAQHALANELRPARDVENVDTSVLGWLRNSANGGYAPSQVELAWIMVASPDSDFRDPKGALELLDEVPGAYYDSVRINETKAAAYAAQGDFRRAVKYQRKAFSEAEKFEWAPAPLELRLAAYQNRKPWIGNYY